MLVTPNSHLSYCTNIHSGESWEEIFSNIESYCIPVKKNISPDKPFGIGLRLSNLAAIELLSGNRLSDFKSWLHKNNMYVYTINGFPYGSFHGEPVKDRVHLPDWASTERLDYTVLLVSILKELLPSGIEGSISTSPLSYRHWFKTDEDLVTVKQKSTQHLVEITALMVKINRFCKKKLHLNIEPEPDGIIETSDEYIQFFTDYLLKEGAYNLAAILKCTFTEAQQHIREHVQLCFDVCHFAVGFEKSEHVLKKMENHGLKIGKIQISAALQFNTSEQVSVKEAQDCLIAFDESTYLHQAVIKNSDGSMLRFEDLGPAIVSMGLPGFEELRTHFHVPIFLDRFDLLGTTQNEIINTLRYWYATECSLHLEVETYTWDVLPDHFQTNITESIERELKWVTDTMCKIKNKQL